MATGVSLGVDGVRVGHHTDGVGATGCTVVRFDQPAIASGEVRGGAPATREFALLDPRRTVERIDAVVLSGGSAFGLAAADGVVAHLSEEGSGFETRHGVVPIVVGVSLYDLGVGDARARPGPADGRRAAEESAAAFETGRVGAGTGATIGNWRGPDAVRPGGIGSASVGDGELVVAALVAVNPAGDLTTEPEGASTVAELAAGTFAWPDGPDLLGENTTIGVIVTNGRFTKTDCRKLAEAGHDGLARAIVPAHSGADGDALVAVARPRVDADLARARLMAAVAVERAIHSVAGI